MKNIGKILFFFLSLCFITSCMQGTEADLEGDSANHNFALNGADLSQHALANIQVYAFKGADQNNMGYNHRVFNMTQNDNILSMVMPTDTWDFVLLSAESGDLGAAVIPAVGSLRQNAKMWECPSAGGKLLSAPEIITARTGEITVTAGGYESRDVSLVRNVSKIVIRIVDAAGLKTGGNHTVSLLEVPKSLTWAGGLYPNKTNPELSTLPMESAATISNGAGGTQTSNDMTFLVPAHQGSDFLSDSPTDLSTHHVTIQVDLEQESGSRLVKTAVLPVVPMANKIIDVNLSVKGQMTVEADVLDWKDVDVDGKLITKTTLNVSKTSCAMPWRDTVYVETNAADFAVKVKTGDTWLTTTKIDGNRVVFEANTSSYTDGSPRNSYVDIVANNVTKRINVTQRPDTGTITAPASFWVSPSTGNTSRTISVTSTGPWQILGGNPPNVLPGISSGGAGTTPITFQALTSDAFLGDYSAYGDADIRIKNTQSLEIITVKASNLFMSFTDIVVGNSEGVNTNTVPNTDAVCLGGNVLNPALYSIVSYPTWVTSITVHADGSLTIVAPGSDDGDSRSGLITFRHNTDPTYQITVDLEQRLMARIPEFDYFTIKFTWGGGTTGDVDIYAYFTENNVAFDNVKLGYNNTNNYGFPANHPHGGYVRRDGTYATAINNNWTDGLLYWGGDAMNGEGEQVFFNAPMVDNDNTLPRKIKFVVDAYRYATTVTVTVQALKHIAGNPATVITHNTFNFSFTNVETVYWSTQTIVTKSAVPTGHSVVVVYDRLLHDAQINYYSTP